MVRFQIYASRRGAERAPPERRSPRLLRALCASAHKCLLPSPYRPHGNAGNPLPLQAFPSQTPNRNINCNATITVRYLCTSGPCRRRNAFEALHRKAHGSRAGDGSLAACPARWTSADTDLSADCPGESRVVSDAQPGSPFPRPSPSLDKRHGPQEQAARFDRRKPGAPFQYMSKMKSSLDAVELGKQSVLEKAQTKRAGTSPKGQPRLSHHRA